MYVLLLLRRELLLLFKPELHMYIIPFHLRESPATNPSIELAGLLDTQPRPDHAMPCHALYSSSAGSTGDDRFREAFISRLFDYSHRSLTNLPVNWSREEGHVRARVYTTYHLNY